MAKPYTWIILFLLPLAAALLNVDLFGPQTLSAYFAYTFFAAVAIFLTAMCLLSRYIVFPLITLPTPILLFIALALYIFLHGLLTHTLNLTHYYWVANAGYLWAAGRLGENRVPLANANRNTPSTLSIHPNGSISWSEPIDLTRTISLLYKGVSLLALLESLVVCCQELGMLPTRNPLYSCTGTWENPNVTAMFLALALYAVMQETVKPGIDRVSGNDPRTASKNRQIRTAYMIAGFILLAIVLLKCRTALLVAVLFIAGHYWAAITTFIRKKTSLSKGVILATTAALSIAIVLLLAVGIKRDSTQGRVRIWETSIRLIAQKPIMGQGFGLFEKQYNLFTANERLPDNDHVNMPYNDFLELGVEGGLGAVALWTATLITLWRHNRKLGYSVLPIVALLLIQFTNFGFQALPVFALFLLYAAIPPDAAVKISPATIRPADPVIPSSGPITFSVAPVTPSGVLISLSEKAIRVLGVGSIQAIALFLSINQAVLADSFYERNTITKNDTGAEAIDAYAGLASSLKGFVSYHLYFGDAYLKMKQYGPALAQYLQGLESSSNPDILFKCGFCYQQLRKYDSSQYYYTLVENMQPYKFGPRLALLKLYQEKGDGPLAKKEAEEIVAMPVKIESNEVVNIKTYAQKILEK